MKITAKETIIFSFQFVVVDDVFLGRGRAKNTLLEILIFFPLKLMNHDLSNVG